MHKLIRTKNIECETVNRSNGLQKRKGGLCVWSVHVWGRQQESTQHQNKCLVWTSVRTFIYRGAPYVDQNFPHFYKTTVNLECLCLTYSKSKRFPAWMLYLIGNYFKRITALVLKVTITKHTLLISTVFGHNENCFCRASHIYSNDSLPHNLWGITASLTKSTDVSLTSPFRQL